METMHALQDVWASLYRDTLPECDYSLCFGCGPDNSEGLRIKSFWNGEECVCMWHSDSHHHGIKGVLNGGIIATLVDCHSFWTALAAFYHSQGRKFGEGNPVRMVSGALSLKYLHPIPGNAALELRAHLAKAGNRSRLVTCSVIVNGNECVQGEVTLVLLD